jgi:hypothetical protein
VRFVSSCPVYFSRPTTARLLDVRDHDSQLDFHYSDSTQSTVGDYESRRRRSVITKLRYIVSSFSLFFTLFIYLLEYEFNTRTLEKTKHIVLFMSFNYIVMIIISIMLHVSLFSLICAL